MNNKTPTCKKNIRKLNKLNKLTDEEFIRRYNLKCPNSTYIPSILPAKRRIVVLGDIHGDLNTAITMLKSAKVVRETQNKVLNWIGGDTYVVQVGDQIDRCRPIGNMLCSNKNTTSNDEASDITILKLFTDLHKEAVKNGGAVISLLGNHEIMNVVGNLDYVSHLGLKEFENYVDPNDATKTFTSGMQARAHAFAPGNEYGKYLGCNRLPAVIIGSNIFVHAGIVNGLIKELGLNKNVDFETINKAIRAWLLGLLKTDYIKDIINSTKYSMFWTRILGKIPPNVTLDNPVCSKHIGQVLKMFNVNGIIIGHTPQSFTYSDDINATCSGTVWRVDNGSSSAFNNFDRDYLETGNVAHSRRVQYLEILNDNVYNVCDKYGCKCPMS